MNIDSEVIDKISHLAAQGFKTRSDRFGGEFVILPEGMKLEHLENEEWVKPDGIEQSIVFSHPDSFVQYVNEYKEENTKILASTSKWRIHAIIDYHKKESAELLRHNAFLSLDLTPEYRNWAGINGVFIPQEDFAEFIEENQKDIITPDGSTILEIASDLKIRSNVEFSSAKRQSDGCVQFSFSENQETQTKRGDLLIPSEIELGIPVFEGQKEGYKFPAFFRYRLHERTLKFKIDIQNIERMQRRAFEDVVASVQNQLGVEILFAQI